MKMMKVLTAAVVMVAVTSSSAGATSYPKRVRRAATCAYKVAVVIDYQASWDDAAAATVIGTMSYKCLVVGAEAEDRYNDDPYGDHSSETIEDVSDAYRVDPADLAMVFCAKYGCP